MKKLIDWKMIVTGLVLAAIVFGFNYFFVESTLVNGEETFSQRKRLRVKRG